jgi:thioester reductase-like protein
LVDHGCELVCVVRARDHADAAQRVVAALGPACPSDRLVAVPGDVLLPGLGLEPMLVRHLQATVDGIVHSAATTAFGMRMELARGINVTGTRNVLDFARRATNLRLLGYVSTAFVAGKRTGTIREADLDHDAGFVTSYERSKYEAELLVRRSAASLPVAVFRPSVVVDPEDEAPDRPSGFRFALSLLRNGVLPLLPAAATTPIDLIDAADAADALARLALADGCGGTYHLTAGTSAPSLSELMRAAGTPPIRFVPEVAFNRELGRLRRTNVSAAESYRRIDTFIRIVGYPKVFANDATVGALGHPVARHDPLAGVRAMFPELSRSVA